MLRKRDLVEKQGDVVARVVEELFFCFVLDGRHFRKVPFVVVAIFVGEIIMDEESRSFVEESLRKNENRQHLRTEAFLRSS